MRKGILTDRQREVVALIAQGKSNDEIAEALVLSLRTVHAHIRNILDALNTNNRTSAVVLALYHGEIGFSAVLNTVLPPATPGPVDEARELSYDAIG